MAMLQWQASLKLEGSRGNHDPVPVTTGPQMRASWQRLIAAVVRAHALDARRGPPEQPVEFRRGILRTTP